MHLVHGGLRRLANVSAGVADEGISPDDHITAGFRSVTDEVISEDGPPRLPILGVQIPAVTGFQLLDRLDLVQAVDITGIRRKRVTGLGVHVCPSDLRVGVSSQVTLRSPRSRPALRSR